ncbi:rhodanese-like domain-containing protein [Aestuariivirga sp.]|uniref:rhodanese-like domain-containing protein n=1 Tax=Aestuariivirga sp. TaxID=2650926 RepID=UPI0039E703B1
MAITRGYKQLLDEANAQVRTVTPQEAQAMAASGEALIIDLRDPREVEREGRIAGAHHCPRGMLEFWIDPESPYHKPYFAEAKSFIFHCASGWRSALAAKTAKDMGLAPVMHMGGGFTAWKGAGLPVESGERPARG